MEKLYVDEAVLHAVFDDRQALSELSEFLTEAMDAEFEKGDEMDCDFIDACTNVLEVLQKENGISKTTLTLLLSQEKFLKAIQKRSAKNTGKYKRLTAICACAVLLVAAGSMYSATETGTSLKRQISNKLSAIFTVENTTALSDPTENTVPENTTAAEEYTEPTAPKPTEPVTQRKPAAVKANAEQLPARIYGIFPNDLKTEYEIGEPLHMQGIHVIAVWEDGKETEIPLSDCSVTTDRGFSRDPGRYNVTVFYRGLSFTYTVTVNAEKDTKILNSIYGIFPEDFAFTVKSFDHLDFSDMTVMAVYSDGSEQEIPLNECEITVEKDFMDLENKALVTVTYEDRAFSFILTKEAQ